MFLPTCGWVVPWSYARVHTHTHPQSFLLTQVCLLSFRACVQDTGLPVEADRYILIAANRWLPILLLFSCSVTDDSLWPHVLQNTRLPCPSPSPWACLNSSPLNGWCHPTISSCVVPFSSCLQSFPASQSFPMTQLFPSGSQSMGASAPASVFPMNIRGWFSLGWTGWISLQSKGLKSLIQYHSSKI